MTAIFVLTALVLVFLLFPIRARTIDFDEKDEVIKIYREEITYIDKQYQKQFIDATDKTQLLAELDRKSAIAMLAVEQKSFTYNRTIMPIIIIVLMASASISLYSHFYQKKGIKNWQKVEKSHRETVLSAIFDERVVRDFVAKYGKQNAAKFCFVMQKKILSHYSTNSGALANLAQCHLSVGEMTLARSALARALRYNPQHAQSTYALAEWEFLTHQSLSAPVAKQLATLAEKKPSVEMLYLLTLNSYAQGNFHEAKKHVDTLKPLAIDYPTLLHSLDALAPQIDAQLYMNEGKR